MVGGRYGEALVDVFGARPPTELAAARMYATSGALIREGTPFEEIVTEGARRGQFPENIP